VCAMATIAKSMVMLGLNVDWWRCGARSMRHLREGRPHILAP
jgi:hypothetical protein